MKSIFLIDPNDNKTDELIEEINRHEISSKNLWLWCSTTPWNEFKDVIDKLEKDFLLFPWRIDQILENYEEASSIIIPQPFPVTYISKQLEEEVNKIQNNNEAISNKVIDMIYILTSTNCSASRVLGLDKIPTNEEIYEYIKSSYGIEDVYIEWWSRNNEVDFNKMLLFLEEIKYSFPNKNIIYGWGIDDLDLAKEIASVSDNIVFSHLIHKNPKMIEEIINTIN